MLKRLDIPENALGIIEELEERLKSLLNEINSYKFDSNTCDWSIYAIHPYIEAFKKNIRLLCYKWCKIRPLHYNLRIVQIKNSYFIFFDATTRKLEFKKFKIPREPGSWFYWFLTNENPSSYIELVSWHSKIKGILNEIIYWYKSYKLSIEIGVDPPKMTPPRFDKNLSISFGEKVYFGHAADYRTCWWLTKRGNWEKFSLTSRQADIIRILAESYRSGYPEITEAEIMSQLNNDGSYMRFAFRGKNVLNRLIVKGDSRDKFKLNIPPE